MTNETDGSPRYNLQDSECLSAEDKLNLIDWFITEVNNPTDAEPTDIPEVHRTKNDRVFVYEIMDDYMEVLFRCLTGVGARPEDLSVVSHISMAMTEAVNRQFVEQLDIYLKDAKNPSTKGFIQFWDVMGIRKVYLEGKEAPTKDVPRQLQPKSDRLKFKALVALQVAQGATYKQAGIDHGISGDRVAQIFGHVTRMLKQDRFSHALDQSLLGDLKTVRANSGNYKSGIQAFLDVDW